MSAEKPYRLPTTVTPERYELKLTPDLTTWTFTGDEKISIHVHEPVREIILNAAELELHAVSLQTADGKVREGRVNLDTENERATLSFGEPVPAGRGDLQIQFSGILNDKLHGFYRSTYKGADGQDKPLASTQFESTDARRAFPCWDEPAFKAVYQVTLVVDEKLTAISNARVVRENALPGNKKAVVFADSMKMSTYLVAFIVGEFEATEPVMVGNAPLRVCAVPGKKHLATFAVDIGKASLEHFSAYYGIPYPGDKLDLIAIPDFASGAMENLGAITFRETALLVDADRATRTELERVADVVSHENAHMWFGDLVTMKWWNGLWLNEAFATFMEMLAVDAWKPEWRRWDSFTVSRAAAMQVDGLKSTRPIEFPVERPEEAAGMFDILTYEKGASVLRMLEQYLGARSVSRRDSALFAPACVCQRRDHRSVGRPRRVDKTAGASADGHVDFSSRLSVDQRRERAAWSAPEPANVSLSSGRLRPGAKVARADFFACGHQDRCDRENNPARRRRANCRARRYGGLGGCQCRRSRFLSCALRRRPFRFAEARTAGAAFGGRKIRPRQ